MGRKRTTQAHQTTIRFSEELWQDLEQAAARRDVSVAQYVRDAARERLEQEPSAAFALEPPPGDRLGDEESRTAEALGSAMRAEERARGASEGAVALWEEGRLARERARRLRAQSQEQRTGRGGPAEEPYAPDRFADLELARALLLKEQAQARIEARHER